MRDLSRHGVTVYELKDGLGYGTPRQLGRLFESVEQTGWEKPDEQFEDAFVRERALSLRNMLDARLGGMLS